PDITCTSNAPGATDMLIEVWDGDALTYSERLPPGTPVIVGGGDINAPGTEVSITTARSKRCPECPFGHVTLIKREAASPITVDGTTVSGNAILCELHVASQLAYAQVLVRGKTAGGTNGATAIAQEALASEPSDGKGMNVLAIQSGAVPTAVAGG